MSEKIKSDLTDDEIIEMLEKLRDYCHGRSCKNCFWYYDDEVCPEGIWDVEQLREED